MKTPTPSATGLHKDYARLRQSLTRIGYISQGSVVDRAKLARPRFGYQWTRKVNGKTITAALSQSEFETFQQAIANERKLWKIVRQMEQLSRRIIFYDRSQRDRRKPLRRKVLGLI